MGLIAASSVFLYPDEGPNATNQKSRKGHFTGIELERSQCLFFFFLIATAAERPLGR